MRFRIKSGQSAHRFVFDRTPAPAKPPAAVRAPRRRPRQPLRAVLRYRPQPRGPAEEPISTFCSLCPAPFKADRGSFVFYFCLFTPV